MKPDKKNYNQTAAAQEMTSSGRWGCLVQEDVSIWRSPAAADRGSTSLFRVLFMISSILCENRRDSEQTLLVWWERRCLLTRPVAHVLSYRRRHLPFWHEIWWNRYLLPLQSLLLLLDVQQLSLLSLPLCLPLGSQEGLLPLKNTIHVLVLCFILGVSVVNDYFRYRLFSRLFPRLIN